MKTRVFQREGLHPLLEALAEQFDSIIGPTLRDGAIVLDEIASDADLPAGWTDDQQPGRYRVGWRDDEAVFGFTVGPHAWKRFLAPPEVLVWTARRDDGRLRFEPGRTPPRRLAFLGVRPCDLAALDVLDRVYLQGPYVDPGYQARRQAVGIVAVNCTAPGGTCFCASMGTGPRAGAGFDLALTEIIGDGRHEFLAEAGTPRGEAWLDKVPSREATDEDRAQVARALEAAAGRMGRQLDTTGLADLLFDNLDHEVWDDVAVRCLTCGNCTLVCPTCFCTLVEDRTSLGSETAERWKRWDSCFSREHSYIHGGFMRASGRSRYRQWLTHKLASWHDQFGTSGCVGCGRCITWCPAGIDITEEARRVRGAEASPASERIRT
jgi:sulfhydrogenase subunit beta (sulfur reductase)